MIELVEMIVKAIVNHPDEVKIREIEGRHTHMIELSVARGDLGKVIGRDGANAQAIRTILSAIGGKEDKRYVLEIIED